VLPSTKAVPLSPLTTRSSDGISQIEAYQSVVLQVLGAAQPIIIKPTHRALIVGRAAQTGRVGVDIDLTLYGGYKKGVSRIHATIRREKATVTIEDMGSANGTYVNGQQLIPGQRCVLRHGDEISLGQLLTTVYFQ
jgi:pSer/pThr/pTyr-binding forkhead associated (FHA) protein